MFRSISIFICLALLACSPDPKPRPEVKPDRSTRPDTRLTYVAEDAWICQDFVYGKYRNDWIRMLEAELGPARHCAVLANRIKETEDGIIGSMTVSWPGVVYKHTGHYSGGKTHKISFIVEVLDKDWFMQRRDEFVPKHLAIDFQNPLSIDLQGVKFVSMHDPLTQLRFYYREDRTLRSVTLNEPPG